MTKTLDEGLFDQAVEIVLQHEGGFVNDKNDPGGATNWGISLRFVRGLDAALCDELGLDIDGDGDVDADDIRAMPRDKAIAVYRTQWWERYGYGRFWDIGVAIKMFDLAVNLGPRPAHRCLQRAVRAVNGKRLVEDGLLGPATLGAVNGIDPAGALRPAIRSEAAGLYRAIIASQPYRFGKYRAGWLRRAYY